MGVKVKLADGREVIDVSGKTVHVAAGEVVEVDEGTARVLTAHNIVSTVHPNTKVTAGEAVRAAQATDDKAASAGKRA